MHYTRALSKPVLAWGECVVVIQYDVNMECNEKRRIFVTLNQFGKQFSYSTQCDEDMTVLNVAETPFCTNTETTVLMYQCCQKTVRQCFYDTEVN